MRYKAKFDPLRSVNDEWMLKAIIEAGVIIPSVENPLTN